MQTSNNQVVCLRISLKEAFALNTIFYSWTMTEASCEDHLILDGSMALDNIQGSSIKRRRRKSTNITSLKTKLDCSSRWGWFFAVNGRWNGLNKNIVYPLSLQHSCNVHPFSWKVSIGIYVQERSDHLVFSVKFKSGNIRPSNLAMPHFVRL